MRPEGHRSRWRRTIVATLAIGLVVPSVVGWHYARLGWKDKHENYPARPTSYSQIVNRFGQPCSDAAHQISQRWTAADTGTTFTVWFHRKLGGSPTEMISDKGGTSTNLDNDVYGHIQNNHLQPYVQHGIYGYACRYIRGSTSQWSTHAFGIAVDVSSAIEYDGKCTSDVNRYMAPIWKDHNWHWGLDFCDPMHFQYATGY